jgi:hypothetical protein
LPTSTAQSPFAALALALAALYGYATEYLGKATAAAWAGVGDGHLRSGRGASLALAADIRAR